MFPKNRAFSLIELIVVVAIIGIMSLIVFSIIKTSTEKSADAKIKAELNQAIIQARIYHDKYGYFYNGNGFSSVGTSYTNCTGNGGIFALGTPNPLSEVESIYRFIWNAQLASDTTYARTLVSNTWIATCGMGFPVTYNNSAIQSYSYAVAIPLRENNIISDTSGTDYYCIDYLLEEGKVIDTIAEMSGESFGEVATCG
jgi:prepilin-type N-terminal cleavage/methylation domain-containing protein